MRRSFRGASLFLGLLGSGLAVSQTKAAEVTRAFASPAEWVVRSWRTEAGLPQNTVNAVVQTRDGFLWVATSGGLARFDGVHFLNFGLQDGLRSVRVSALLEDTRGVLWIGTLGGGLSRREAGRFTSFGMPDSLSSGADVISLADGHDGSLWVGTTQGLLRWSDGVLSVVGEAQGLPRDQVCAVVKDTKGVLWVSALEHGLYQGRNGKFSKFEGGGPAPTYSLLEDREGAIWAGGGNGQIWRWRDGAWDHFDTRDGLPMGSFRNLSQGADGTLLICAGPQGLYRESAGRFVPAISDGKARAPTALAAMVDREGSLWVCTLRDGLYRFSNSVLQSWAPDIDPNSGDVYAIAEDATGGCWVAMGSAGLYRFEQGRFSKAEDPGISKESHHLYSIVPAGDGSFWAAGEQCLYRLKAGQPAQAFLDPPMKGEAIRALCVDGDTLWLGTYYSTLLKYDSAGLQVGAPRGSFHGAITSIVTDAPGSLWIGSSGGVHRWEGGRIVRSWTTSDGLITANVRALYRDLDGTLWIGTQGGGLARLKDGRISNITTQNGLRDDVIVQIVADDYGWLTVGSNRGIMRLARGELHAVADGKLAELHVVALGRDEGMLNEQCSGGHSPSAIKTRDGRLLFPTAGGIVEISPRQLDRITSAVHQPSIDAILVDGRAQPFEKALLIPPGDHRIEVNYSAPALRSGEWVRFRHRLDGRDGDWVGGNGKGLAAYDGLAPGSYHFRLQAADGHGTWNPQSTELALTVQPFVWQRHWFQLLAGAVVVSASGGAAWLHAHRKHAQEIAEMERARQHQAELARVSRVSLLGELSASLAHELKQPLTAILSNAQAAQRFLSHEPVDLAEVSDILRDITDADRRASEIITRMRAMMQKGEAQMEARDLNSDLEQVLRLVRSDLVNRNVSINTVLAADLPAVKGDHIQLQQVLLNLIINGCDAMQATPPTARQLEVVTTLNREGTIQVSVADGGAGITPGMEERIFEPFYSTKETGLGMGLAICQAIIKAHGGHLWAENNADGGATFHFTVAPFKEPEAKKAEGPGISGVLSAQPAS